MDVDQMTFAELHAALRYHVTESIGVDVDRIIAIVQAMKAARAREQQTNARHAA